MIKFIGKLSRFQLSQSEIYDNYKKTLRDINKTKKLILLLR